MPSNEYIFIFLPHPTPDLFSPSKIESHTNANFLRVKFPRKVIQVLIAKCQIITYTHTTTTTTMPTPEGAGNNFLCLKFQYSQAKQNGRMKASPAPTQQHPSSLPVNICCGRRMPNPFERNGD